MNLDDKISFFSGSILTFTMAAPLYEMAMALVLGVVGGFAGMMGKQLFYFIKDKFSK